MTEKRYELRCCSADGNLVNVIQKEDKIYTSKEIVDILNQKEERIKELEKENASIKDRIFNAMVKSNQVECDCTTCVCEDYVYEELKKW